MCLYNEYPKSSITHKKSCCSSSCMRELQGSRADLGTLTAAVDSGIVGIDTAKSDVL